MNHGSLFSGIGGFDLAAEWMGWNNLFHCEWNSFGQKILKYYWPNAKSYDDITKSTFIEFRGSIDILTGGFPCQPFSAAGKRKGTEDDRHLWPEMLRVIQEIKPRYIVGENVRGLINWNGGMVFDQVCSDLESENYEVLPFLLPAASVNAPHKRDRIWFIASNVTDTKSKGSRKQSSEDKSGSYRRFNYNGKIWNASDTDSKMLEFRNSSRKTEESTIKEKRIESPNGSDLFFANSSNERLQGGKEIGNIRESGKESNEQSSRFIRNSWQEFPTVTPICVRNDGVSDRLDRITFSKWRKESIKAGGNAIVPQVAFEIFKVIEKMENLKL